MEEDAETVYKDISVRVGDSFQASIPPLLEVQESIEPPGQLLWNPHRLDPHVVDRLLEGVPTSYYEEVCSLFPAHF